MIEAGKSEAAKEVVATISNLEQAPMQNSEVSFGISLFLDATRVYLGPKAKAYDHVRQYLKGTAVRYETEYSLYEASVGAGNLPIYVRSKHKLELGESQLYLRQISTEELADLLKYVRQSFLPELCKKLGIPTTSDNKPRTRDDIIGDLLTNRPDHFFDPVPPVSKQELRRIGNPMNAVLEILRNGLQKAPALDLLYAATLPEINPESIRPEQYMKAAPHMIVITNGKTGKSYNALQVTGEPAVERPSEAGLLGYATADTPVHGKLHMRTKQTVIEEIQEEKGEELLGKLHTYMEQGKTEIVRGVGVRIQGYSGITFQGNPKQREEEVDHTLHDYLMVKQFRDVLTIISKNTGPFGTRIGVVLFDHHLPTARGMPNDPMTTERGQKILRSLAESFRDEFTSLYVDKFIMEWINAPYDKEYVLRVESIVTSCNDRMVREFLKGQLDAYRHAKGIALRLAWLQIGITSVMEDGCPDLGRIIQAAEDYLAILQQINLKSYANIVTMLEGDAYEKIKLHQLETMRPDYLRYAAFTVFEWLDKHQDSTDSLLPMALIEPSYAIVKTQQGILGDHKYRSFSRVRDTLEKYLGGVRATLAEIGLDYDRDQHSFIILNRSQVSQVLNSYRKVRDTPVTTVTEDVK